MTGKVINNVIEVRQGDSFVLNFFMRTGGQPVDLSGARLKMQVRDDDGNLVFEINGTGVDAKQGKMALVLTPEQTKNPVGNYKTDIQLAGADGSVNTIFPANVGQTGIFIITEQVTE